MDDDARDWKRIALYLADCHAATMQGDGQLSSVSKSRKARYKLICTNASMMIRGKMLPPYRGQFQYDDDASVEAVLERLEK